MHLIMAIVVGVFVLMLNVEYQKFGIQAHGAVATKTYDHDELRAVNGSDNDNDNDNDNVSSNGNDSGSGSGSDNHNNSNSNSNSPNDRNSDSRNSRNRYRNRSHSFTRSRINPSRSNASAANIKYNAEAFIGRRRQRQQQQQKQQQQQQRQTPAIINTNSKLPAAATAPIGAGASSSSVKSKTTRTGTSSVPTSVTLPTTSSINARPSYSIQQATIKATRKGQHQQQQQQQQQQQSAFVYKAALPPTLEVNNNNNNSKKDNSDTYSYNYNNKNNNNNNNNNKNDKQHFMNVNSNDNFNGNIYKLQNESDWDKNIMGSSAGTSVSVVLNGDEPQFTDAMGHRVPKPQPSVQVASPIDLLNPDRYEFYTFDETGELIKRLMTMEEIQSIVANGDGEGPTYIHSSTDILNEPDPEHKVQDIVKNVQNVLNKEVATNKNNSQSNVKPLLDTPDVSASWSMILPAIFGNTGDDIFPKQKPQQIIMTPESEIIEASTSSIGTTSTTITTPSSGKLDKRKPSVEKHQISVNTTPITTKITPQVVQEELDPNESVYTGLQQYQNMAANMENFDNYAQFNIHPMYQHSANQTQEIIDSDIIMLEEEGSPAVTSTTKIPQRKKKPTTQISVTSTISSTSSTTSSSSSSSSKYTPTSMKHKLKKKPSTTAIPLHSNKPIEHVTSDAVLLTTTKPLTNKYDSINNFDTTQAINKRKHKPNDHLIMAHHQANLAEKPQIAEIELLKSPLGSPMNVSPKPTTIISVIKRKKKPTTTQQFIITTTSIPITTTRLPPAAKTTTTTTTTTAKPPTKTTTKITEQEEEEDDELTIKENESLINKNSVKPLNNLELESINGPEYLTPHIFHGIFKPRPTTQQSTTTTTTTTRTEPTTTTVIYAPVPTASQTLPPSSPNGQSLVVIEGFPGITSPSSPASASASSSFAMTMATTPKIDSSVKFASTINSIADIPAITFYGNEDTNASPYKEDDSAEHLQQDLHTLESFDKIMQSLTQSLTYTNKFNEQSTTKPTKYNSAENFDQLEDIADKRKKPINLKDTELLSQKLNATKPLETESVQVIAKLPLTTVQPFTVNEEGSTLPIKYSSKQESFTVPPNTMEAISNESDDSSIVLITAKPQYNSSSYKLDENQTSYTTTATATTEDEKQNEEADEEEKEMDTTVRSSDNLFNHMESTTISYMENSNDETSEIELKAETQLPNTIINDKKDIFTITLSTLSDVATEIRTTTDMYSASSTDIQTTENPVMVMDLMPNLNMEIIKPTDQITMNDFQTQAATVASTLLDSFHTYPPDMDEDKKLNDTNNDYKDLFSDVLQQMTDDHIEDSFDYNRLSTFAHLNTSFLPDALKKFVKRPGLLHSYATINKLTEETVKENIGKINSENIDVNYKQELKPILGESLKEIVGNDNFKENNETLTRKTNDENVSGITSEESSIEMDESTEEFTTKRSRKNNTISNDLKNLVDSIDKTTEIDYTVEEIKLDHIQSSNLLKEPQMEFIKNLDREALFESFDSKDTVTDDSTEVYKITSNESDGQAEKAEEEEEKEKEEKEEEEKEKENDQSTEYENYNETTTTEFDITDWSMENLSESVTANNTDITVTERTDIETEDVKTSSESLFEAFTEPLQKRYEAYVKHNHNDSILSATYSQNQYTQNSYVKEDEENVSFEGQYTHDGSWAEEVTSPKDQNNNTNVEVDQYKENSDWTHGEMPSKHEFSESTERLIAETSFNDQFTSNSEWLAEGTTLKGQHTKPNNIWKAEDDGPKEIELTTEYPAGDNYVSEKLKDTPHEMHNIEVIFEGDPYVKLGETTQKIFTTISSTIPPSTVSSSFAKEPSNNKDAQLKIEDKTVEFFNINNQSLTVDSVNERAPLTNATIKYKPMKKFPASSGSNRPLKPVSYFNKQSNYGLQQNSWGDSWYSKPELALQTQPSENRYAMPQPQQTRPMNRPPQLNNLMASATQATRPPVKLDPSPIYSKGLEASLFQMDKDVLEFTELCNELAFSYWKAITSEKISSARGLVISPFALTSMLSMVFLGARGSTSGEMNDMLRLDDMVTFNPHLIFKNITYSVERTKDNNIATAAFVRELFSDRSNGKVLQFFKERAQQIYSGHVEEVNFNVVNDIIRRRTNLLIKRHTMGKVFEYLRTNSIWLNGPLATLTANLYQTNCSAGSTVEKDGEMFFQVHPTIRQRRLIPIPAVVFRNGFTAGYEPTLDATAAAFGTIQNTVSVIYIMPGHQNSASPADNLNRLEKDLMETAISNKTWSKLLTSLMERPGLEVQLPRFSHRSFINATLGLQKLGLSGLFRSDYADLGGLTGSTKRDIYLSDMIQINTFSTCGEEKIADHHHVEMYPAPPLRKRNKNVEPLISQNDNSNTGGNAAVNTSVNTSSNNNNNDEQALDSSEAIIDFGSLVHDTALGRGFYDDLLNPKYLELPLPLRPRQARVPDAPRLRFDKPFLYFIRHNPTGMILFIGRFNPRLLP